MESREVLRVNLLGGFEIQRLSDGETQMLSEQIITSRRLGAFLQYLTVFHQRNIGQEELIDALWYDSDSTNPANTLKTLLHRARTLLERLGFEDGKSILHYQRGVYSWSADIALELDTEQFDTLCAQADDCATEKQLELARKAMELYTGDFLPNSMGTPWMVSLRTYYHTKYLKLCCDAARSLIRSGLYDSAEHVCREASAVDPYDETCHLLLMQALAEAGTPQLAIRHYHHVASMFMDQLNATPSSELTEYYRQLTKAECSFEMDLNIVRDLLLEKQAKAGAFFCEFPTFQNIYRLEARRVLRSGRVVQLAMITVLDSDGSRLEDQRCLDAMEDLKGIIQTGLRAGDTFAKFSSAQFLILLPTATYENAQRIFRRILAVYRQTFSGRNTTTEVSILPVLPAGGESPEDMRFQSFAEE